MTAIRRTDGKYKTIKRLKVNHFPPFDEPSDHEEFDDETNKLIDEAALKWPYKPKQLPS